MRYWLLAAGVATGLLAGCDNSDPPKARPGAAINSGDAPKAGPVVRLDALTLTAPATWNRVQPRSSIIAAEFSLPRAEGDSADGRLTVSTAGGSVEANLERWKGQFSKLESSHEEKLDTPVGAVTVVDFAGEFNDQPGPFAPAVQRSAYRMLAAIIPINGQLHFVKAVGPQKTIGAHAEEIKAFVRSVQRGG